MHRASVRTSEGEGVPSPWSGIGAWMVLGMLGGSALLLLRVRALVGGWGAGEGTLAEWHAAGRIPRELLRAVVWGLAAAAGSRLALGRGRRPALRIALAALAFLASAAFVLEGSTSFPPLRRLDASDLLVPGGELSRFGVMLLLLLLAHCTAAWFLACRSERIRTAGVLPMISCAGFVLALPWLYGLVFPAPGMVLEEVRRDLILDGPTWEVVRSHPKAPPTAGIINPSVNQRVDSVDLPALVMTPPCEVIFRVEPRDGPVELRAAAGVDRSVTAQARVGFRITRNGTSVFEARIPVREDVPAAREYWRRAELPDFAPGDEISLSTWLVGIPDEQASQRPPMKLGFGELLLLRRAEVPRTRSNPRRPSVLLVVQDAHRADRLSCAGFPRPTTPNVDRLAQRGVRYSNAYSTASWTWPATASILTGLLPDAHGVLDDDRCYLAESLDTLPEVLQRHGFTTGGFSCNPLIARQKNFDQGFETFDSDSGRFRKTGEVLGRVLSWLDDNAGSRFFLYLHLVDPHTPHLPHGRHLQRFAATVPGDVRKLDVQKLLVGYERALNRRAARGEQGEPLPWPFPPEHLEWILASYDACVATSDEYVGQVLERLELLGLERETVVVFTSDHGEEWFDHGLLMHGKNLHRELVQVPLVIAGPGIPRGVVVDTPVSNRHLAPTLTRLARARMPRVVDALDLLGGEALPRLPVFFSTEHGWTGDHRQPIYGVRRARWLLHFAPQGLEWNGKVPGGWVRLFDLAGDPGELVDVAEQHPGLAGELRGLILESLESQIALRPDVRLEAGEHTLEMLREIGYLDE